MRPDNTASAVCGEGRVYIARMTDGEEVANGRSALLDRLGLMMLPGVGPIHAQRLLETFGSAEKVFRAKPAALSRVKGIGEKTATAIVRARAEVRTLAEEELARAEAAGVAILPHGEPGYPPLLAQIPAAPGLLYVRGALDAAEADRYAVAIVGSRRCSAYGVEQAERFGGLLARSGVTVVSGGARGIDTAAHRGALRAGGRTIVVQGCGLGGCYPPENAKIYDQIVAEGRGAVVSELPMNAAPIPENFPARNRIISGLSLGVIVIEANARSGALITARLAAEDQGREVMALPGRVDSRTSEGTHELIKKGGALLVTSPADVLELLESPARHHHGGTHEARYAPGLFESAGAGEDRDGAPERASDEGGGVGLTEVQRAILAALESPLTPDQLAAAAALAPERLRVELTLLELRGQVMRSGTVVRRVV